MILGGRSWCKQGIRDWQRQEYEIAEGMNGRHPIGFLLKLMDVNSSGYYKWLKQKDTDNCYERNRKKLTSLLFIKNRKHKSWGYHRLAAEVRKETGWLFSDKLAHKCCKQAESEKAITNCKDGLIWLRLYSLTKQV